jgi:hypothetical protein
MTLSSGREKTLRCLPNVPYREDEQPYLPPSSTYVSIVISSVP